MIHLVMSLFGRKELKTRGPPRKTNWRGIINKFTTNRNIFENPFIKSIRVTTITNFKFVCFVVFEK